MHRARARRSSGFSVPVIYTSAVCYMFVKLHLFCRISVPSNIETSGRKLICFTHKKKSIKWIEKEKNVIMVMRNAKQNGNFEATDIQWRRICNLQARQQTNCKILKIPIALFPKNLIILFWILSQCFQQLQHLWFANIAKVTFISPNRHIEV